MEPAPTPQTITYRCEHETPRWKKKLEFIAVGIALLLLVVNILVMWATQQAADSTTKALHLDQRAWVIPSAKMPQLKDGKIIHVPFSLLNTGRSPALGFEGVIVVNVLPESEAPEFIYTKGTRHPHYRIPGTTFYPNNPAEYSFPVIDRTVEQTTDVIRAVVLTPTIRKQLDSGTSWIVAHGELGYRDIFGIDHWAHFCYPLSPNSRGIDESIQKCAAFNAVDTNQ